VEEGSGDLGPHYMNLYENLSRFIANEIVEHSHMNEQDHYGIGSL